MSLKMENDVKRWTAKRKSALVLDIIQGKSTVAEASRAYDLSPSEVEKRVDDAKRGMENALRANPLDVKEQYERQVKDLQEACGEAMLELCARKKFAVPVGRGREVIETELGHYLPSCAGSMTPCTALPPYPARCSRNHCRRASFMRVCQPGPSALNASMISAS